MIQAQAKIISFANSMTYIDGSCPVERIRYSLVIPIMWTVHSDGYQCVYFDVEVILSKQILVN